MRGGIRLMWSRPGQTHVVPSQPAWHALAPLAFSSLYEADGKLGQSRTCMVSVLFLQRGEDQAQLATTFIFCLTNKSKHMAVIS